MPEVKLCEHGEMRYYPAGLTKDNKRRDGYWACAAGRNVPIEYRCDSIWDKGTEVAKTAEVAVKDAGTVAPRRGKGSQFPSGFFSMTSDDALERQWRNTNLKAPHRLEKLALWRQNRWNHCPFYPGEVRKLLGIDYRTLQAAFKSLADAGIISDESTELCIVLDRLSTTRNDRKNETCMEPAHMQRKQRLWAYGIGWEPNPGAWQQMMDTPEERAAVNRGEFQGWNPAPVVAQLEIEGKLALDGKLKLTVATAPQVQVSPAGECPDCGKALVPDRHRGVGICPMCVGVFPLSAA